MAMQGRTDWLAANDHPKRHLEAPTREWTRPRGETWYRRTPPAAAGRRTGAATEAGSRHLLVTASRVAGCGVYTASGRRLGRVAEIALDETTGDVAFVVVASGGFLGFGERLARAPWSALSYEPDRAGYVLDLPESEVDALTAPAKFHRSADRGGWASGA